MLIWLGAAFVSILLHEFGHVLAFRYYGQRARVVMWALGGLAIPDGGNVGRGGYDDGYGGYDRGYGESWRGGGGSATPDGWQQIVISAAGPAAGFLLAGAIIGMLYGVGVSCPFLFGLTFGRGPWIESDGLLALTFYLLQVNILWGVINLLPIYPLDGGQISRELFLMADYRRGIRRSLVLSTVTAAAGAVAMLVWQGGQGLYGAVMAGMLAYSSYTALKAYDQGWN
jgi:Zn-dependent protease